MIGFMTLFIKRESLNQRMLTLCSRLGFNKLMAMSVAAIAPAAITIVMLFLKIIAMIIATAANTKPVERSDGGFISSWSA